MGDRTYPSDPAEAALLLFQRWLGSHYARSTAAGALSSPAPGVRHATVTLGRRWTIEVTVVSALEAEATVAFEAARAALERRLEAGGRTGILWVPRDAAIPAEEPYVSELVAAAAAAVPVDEARHEVRMAVRLHLRRTATTGSVVTVLGGLAAHWAQFTSRVPGSFQLNSLALHRLPLPPEERQVLADRVVLAAQQPEVDDTVDIPADDAWTLTCLDGDRWFVIGTPAPENDQQNAALRRTLRTLLRSASPPEGEHTALVVLGAATYAEEEKLSWALRGMDPALYAGYSVVAVVTDGVVKTLLEPARGSLPWDAPLQ